MWMFVTVVDCTIPKCFGISALDESVCSGNGICIGKDQMQSKIYRKRLFKTAFNYIGGESKYTLMELVIHFNYSFILLSRMNSYELYSITSLYILFTNTMLSLDMDTLYVCDW
jgi:hypothetical protein